MTVQVNGLPRSVRGNIKITGPAKTTRRVNTTTKLTGIAPGTYNVSAQPVVWDANTYRPTITRCLAPGRCSFLFHGRITVTARQSVTVRVTYAPAEPLTPPSYRTPVGSPQPSAEGPLSSKKSESGGWSVTISVPKGGPQTQAAGVVSFPIPLKKGEKVKITYRNAQQALEPKPPCLGSVNDPAAEPGNLCVYRGGAGFGSGENEDKNAKFVQVENFFGETINETGEANSGDLGVLLIFRTNEFASEGAPLTLAKEASLTAAGSWALTAK
jgi:hypothetical protein